MSQDESRCPPGGYKASEAVLKFLESKEPEDDVDVDNDSVGSEGDADTLDPFKDETPEDLFDDTADVLCSSVELLGKIRSMHEGFWDDKSAKHQHLTQALALLSDDIEVVERNFKALCEKLGVKPDKDFGIAPTKEMVWHDQFHQTKDGLKKESVYSSI